MQSEASTPVLILILGSAAVGALVSSAMTLIGQYVERKARRKELLLAESVRLAMAHRESLVEIAKLGRTEVFVPEHVRLVQTYFIGLNQLLLDGTLPKGMFTTDAQNEKETFQRKWSK